MATKTEKNVQLKINKMTKNIFDQLSVQGLISEDELYLLSDDETGSATWGTIGGELSNQTDLKIMLDSKADKSEISGIVTVVGDDGEIYNNLSAIHLTQYEYYQLMQLSALKPNYLYILDKDNYIDAFGKQIKNLSGPTDLSDAVTKWYVDNAVSSQSIDPAVLSAYALSTAVDARLSQKADKSQIPTVNNPTITFTQGNAVKGSITLNQANDQTISLDAGGGGGGGGEIPADLSCNHLSVGTGIVVGQFDTTPNKGKGALVVNTVFKGTNTYSTDVTGIAIGSRAVANHSYSIAIGCAADATAQTTAQNQIAICAGNYGNAADTADHILLGGNQRDPQSLTEYIREIAAASSANTEDFKFAPFDPSSGHSQEGNYINIGNSYSQYDKGIICFIVKFGETYPINLEWQDPVTYNTVQEEVQISNNDSSTTEVAQLFVVPCTFGYGVNISNSYGSQMKVDELFKIEIQNAYSI